MLPAGMVGNVSGVVRRIQPGGADNLSTQDEEDPCDVGAAADCISLFRIISRKGITKQLDCEIVL